MVSEHPGKRARRERHVLLGLDDHGAVRKGDAPYPARGLQHETHLITVVLLEALSQDLVGQPIGRGCLKQLRVGFGGDLFLRFAPKVQRALKYRSHVASVDTVGVAGLFEPKALVRL